ncbi:alpha/beta hydrolase [Sphingomonas sp.]|uniref:alpha/beta hydrolase n=1 Tax=Sphingomonas sp. TaxID=28214 RepID=UPI001B221C93|nr:alpha/beta hydrolase [Sphingomonas sp.]MBO9715095.1 alpha/beta hydrolase [Sphingomonas sp.]
MNSEVRAPVLAEGIAEYLAAVRVAPPGTPLETARLLADLHADRIAYPRPEGMAVTTSFAAGETPVRLYRPAGEGVLPGIVYFHGGGFTTGSIESYEPLAMALAEAADAVVVSVHYDRLPETTPRALLKQCYKALCWAAAMAGPLGIDADRLAVAGDSAGGFIAAQLAILVRDCSGPPLAAQLLCYGLFDIDETRPGYRSANDLVLSRPILDMMLATYRECDAIDPAPVPPLHCPDLSGLPPALLIGAEHDPLLDEARDYAERLRLAGVPAELLIAPQMPHGFLRAVRFSAPARREMRRLGDAFRALIDKD